VFGLLALATAVTAYSLIDYAAGVSAMGAAKGARGLRLLSAANLVSLARVLLAPLILLLLASGTREAISWALIIAGIAALSDVADGYIARRRGAGSEVETGRQAARYPPELEAEDHHPSACPDRGDRRGARHSRPRPEPGADGGGARRRGRGFRRHHGRPRSADGVPRQAEFRKAGVKLLYFAWVRQKIGLSEEEFPLPSGVENVAQLMDVLSTRGPGYAEAFGDAKRLRCAVNQSHVPFTASVRDGDEVAFFPPVTGGA
jgi:molybdopterin synthase sulfur carrier subunit